MDKHTPGKARDYKVTKNSTMDKHITDKPTDYKVTKYPTRDKKHRNYHHNPMEIPTGKNANQVLINGKHPTMDKYSAEKNKDYNTRSWIILQRILHTSTILQRMILQWIRPHL